MPKIVDHEERRGLIAAAAAQLIAERGLEKVTIQAIAAHCGYSQGMVLHYFRNKSALICSALEWCDQQYEARCARASAGLQGLAAARARLEQALPLSPEVRTEWSIAVQLWSQLPFNAEVAEYFSQRRWDLYGQLGADLEHARAEGKLRQDVALGEAIKGLIATVTGIGVTHLFHPGQFQPEQQLRLLENAFSALQAG